MILILRFFVGWAQGLLGLKLQNGPSSSRQARYSRRRSATSGVAGLVWEDEMDQQTRHGGRDAGHT